MVIAEGGGEGVECGRGPGKTTQVAPWRSGAQISSVEASNQAGARWSQVRVSSMWAKSCPGTRRSTLRWGTTTPLGRPVDPDVNIT